MTILLLKGYHIVANWICLLCIATFVSTILLKTKANTKLFLGTTHNGEIYLYKLNGNYIYIIITNYNSILWDVLQTSKIGTKNPVCL